MTKQSKNGCGGECCPSGLVEHIKYYKHMRRVTDITFFEYWWHEIKSLFGGNR